MEITALVLCTALESVTANILCHAVSLDGDMPQAGTAALVLVTVFLVPRRSRNSLWLIDSIADISYLHSLGPVSKPAFLKRLPSLFCQGSLWAEARWSGYTVLV